jgi:sugar phosphate isomerase/epimerase
MQIKFFCPRWGSEEIPFETFAAQVKAAGYDGVEMMVPPDNIAEIAQSLAQHNLLFIAQIAQDDNKSFEENMAYATEMVSHAAALKPLKINSQTGKDYFSFEQNMQFIELYNNLQQQIGIPIMHELHRGRFNYAPLVTNAYFNAAKFTITADFSHWCCVTESLLTAQQWQPVIQEAIQRSIHIHARVGFGEGPQVNDPRALEHKPALDAHMQWWDAIIAHQQKQQTEVFTITPEFGPSPYMPAMPHTQEPLVSQWEVNVYMMNVLKAHYKNRVS